MLKEKSWKLIKVVESWLMIYACCDFFCQIIAQLSIFPEQPVLAQFGFNKIWKRSA
jgi:hypothetical protein